MKSFKTEESNITIQIANTPFTSGGEGELYKILKPINLQGHCLKLYYSQYRTIQKRDKLRSMILNSPLETTDDNNYMICWVKDLVFQDGDFVGFIMPLAFESSIELYELCTLNLRKNLNDIWHKKFKRSEEISIQNRLKLCVNISIAVHNIHKTRNYVLVDMKPQNILVTPDGKVSIVDLDSIQISNGLKVTHRGHVATPEYTPVEGFTLNPNNDYIPETWDRFSLGIIFYELIFGIHPFVATSVGKYENITTIDGAIKNGLFVFGKSSKYLQVPHPHNNFHKLPESIKNLFKLTFNNGHNNPNERPTAETWGKVFYESLESDKFKEVIECPNCQNKLRYQYTDKKIKVKCPKCNTIIELKNSQIIGYIGEKIVEKPLIKTVEVEKVIVKNNGLSLVLSIFSFLLAVSLIFGYGYYKSKLNEVVNENNIMSEQNSDLLNSLSKLTTKLNGNTNTFSVKPPFIITNIEFSNEAENRNISYGFSNNFQKDKIDFIWPRLTIVSLVNDLVDVELEVTIYLSKKDPYSIQGLEETEIVYSYKVNEKINQSTEILDNVDGFTTRFEKGKYTMSFRWNETWLGNGNFQVY